MVINGFHAWYLDDTRNFTLLPSSRSFVGGLVTQNHLCTVTNCRLITSIDDLYLAQSWLSSSCVAHGTSTSTSSSSRFSPSQRPLLFVRNLVRSQLVAMYSHRLRSMHLRTHRDSHITLGRVMGSYFLLGQLIYVTSR